MGLPDTGQPGEVNGAPDGLDECFLKEGLEYAGRLRSYERKYDPKEDAHVREEDAGGIELDGLRSTAEGN
jgi:hypothetical protein